MHKQYTYTCNLTYSRGSLSSKSAYLSMCWIAAESIFKSLSKNRPSIVSKRRSSNSSANACPSFIFWSKCLRSRPDCQVRANASDPEHCSNEKPTQGLLTSFFTGLGVRCLSAKGSGACSPFFWASSVLNIMSVSSRSQMRHAVTGRFVCIRCHMDCVYILHTVQLHTSTRQLTIAQNI